MSRGHDDSMEVPVREGDDETMTVEFSYYPGTEPSGMSGPPEFYDPGAGPEIDILSPNNMSVEEEERVVNYIFDNYIPPEDEGPDPDFYYDMRRDEGLD